MRHAIVWSANFAVWAAVFLLIGWMQAQAQVPCMPAKIVLWNLMGPKYGEMPLAVGTMATGGGMLFTANAQSGTWTLLAVSPDNKTLCVVLSGNGFSPATSAILDKLIGPRT